METIFVSMPSMYDTELIPSVLNLFEAAEHPERVFVGVSLLDNSTRLHKLFLKKTKKYSSNIRYSFKKLTYFNALAEVGVGKGRKRAQDLYGDEDYFLQCDSHSLFKQNWDSELIALHKDAVKAIPDKKIVLTAYAAGYKYIDNVRTAEVDKPGFWYPVYRKGQRFSHIIPNWDTTNISTEDTDKKFIPCPKFNANFAFGDKQFAHFTGVYEMAVFFEEEPIQTLTLRANNFALVFPVVTGQAPVSHYYDASSSKGFGYRKSLYAYTTRKQSAFIAELNWYCWFHIIRDPKNYAILKEYEEYSGCSLRYGIIKEGHTPTYY